MGKGLGPLTKWIEALKAEGVYIWLDLHVGRALNEGDQQTPQGELKGFDEIKRKKGIFKGFNYYNPIVEDLMIDFNRKYLEHFKDDPAVMSVLVSNENDLMKHFQSPMLDPDRYPYHHVLFLDATKDFAEKSGLSRSRVRRTWDPGDGRLFLMNQEALFYQRMITSLRELGITAPIAVGSVWGAIGLDVLPSLSLGDLIDVHSYAKPETLATDPRYTANIGAWAASYSLPNKPTTISEWGVEKSVISRAVLPMFMVGLGSLQSWAALMHYNYSQTTFWEGGAPDTWSSYIDPATISLMPAAAVAFRQNHIAPARKIYYIPLTPSKLTSMTVSPQHSLTLRTLSEQSAIRIGLPAIQALPWLKATHTPKNSIEVMDLNRDFLSKGATSVTSDTGQLKRNWKEKLYTIDTPKTQAAEGMLRGKTVDLSNLSVEVNLPVGVIVLTSLDDAPIDKSERLLLTTVGRAEVRDDKLPFYAEPTIGKIAIKAKEGLKIYPLNRDGTKKDPLTATYEQGVYHLTLTGTEGTLWYLLS